MQPISRREFSAGLMSCAATTLLARADTQPKFKFRQFHNQPAESPLHRRLTEMWTAVQDDTGGQVRVETFADNNQIPGGDPAALNMVVSGELDFFTENGGSLGNIIPAMNAQGILFAFHSLDQVFAALDGALGDYLRDEAATKGLYALPKGCFDNGLHQITCASRPIRSAADLQGLRIRTPDAAIYVEAWKALGALPVAVNLNKLYETLKSGAAEAQTNPLAVAEFLKLYEVQKYVSVTNHGWTGFNLVANLKLWQGLPSDVRAVIERNVVKYVRLQRADNATLNSQLRAKLSEQGMTFNDADTASFRRLLGPYYARCKDMIGERAWSLLQEQVGKLG